MAENFLHEDLRLGRYVLKRHLGEGGNGQVFLAWQENAANEPLACVVKFPRVQYATNEEARTAFFDEARLAMRLGNHPNVVQVIDVGEHRSMPFIAMEYVDGIDLHRLLVHARDERRPFSLPAAYHLLADLAEALHHAHYGATIAGERVGVVHRDVKPANVLVTRDGVAKLADFGIGTTIEEDTSGQYMRGTHRYMSPEHLRCEPCPEMDVYALGIIAWEVFENRQYREAAKGTQHFTAIMNGEIPAMRADAPAALVSLVESCLDVNPKLRPTAWDFINQLQRCPGFTRDPTELRAHVAGVIGTRRSSGRTEHDFAVSPELAAVFTALDIAEARPVRKKLHVDRAQQDPSESFTAKPLQSPAAHVVARRPTARPDKSKQTPKIRNPFFDAPDEDPSARDADLPSDAETDAPRLRRRPRLRVQAKIMNAALRQPQHLSDDNADDVDAPVSRQGAERGDTAPAATAEPTPGPMIVPHPQTAATPSAPSATHAQTSLLRVALLVMAITVAAIAAAVSFAEFALSDNLDARHEDRSP